MMPGLAPVFSLPGDKMFQATGIIPGYQRPVIMHAYGGAKAGMHKALRPIAGDGWLPMAAAMLGTEHKPPMWIAPDLRPVVGTTIDLKVKPAPLSERETLLILTCWSRWDPTTIPGCALVKWLTGVEVELGPDGIDSPSYLQINFDAMDAAQLYQSTHLLVLEELFQVNQPDPQGMNQAAIRISTYEYSVEALRAIYFLSITGFLLPGFPREQWNRAVKWHGESKVVAVITSQADWAFVMQLGADNVVIEATDANGEIVWTSTHRNPTSQLTAFPYTVVIKTDKEIQRHLPDILRVETTGLGGRDLNTGTPWDLCIRSDGNLRHRPEALFALFRQFLQRLALPRLCHFLDLVLPQLAPVKAPWANARRTLWSCHHIRVHAVKARMQLLPKVAISYFFSSHDGIHHVRIHWGTAPLLLFSDPRVVEPIDTYKYQEQKVNQLNQQHIQLGLRDGMTVLLYYKVNKPEYVDRVFQVVLMAHGSVTNQGKKTENKLWKRVVPSVTEFAWLPPDIA